MSATAYRARLIAFYLPQFHPIPENDHCWGRGFTEWMNVVKARPRFAGHHQPHEPADLGYYDLRVPETRQAQVDLARRYGIQGFCYWHYWFSGRRLLERPFEEVLRSGEPEFPFCLAWANENWTRRWDGQDEDVLLRQDCSFEDDRRHIRALIPSFRDARYIRIGGKPLFSVYRANSLPDPARTAAIWREEAEKAGLRGLYLCSIRSLPELHFDPTAIGFDAAIDFQPDWKHLPEPRRPARLLRLVNRLLSKDWGDETLYRENIVNDYAALVENMIRRPDSQYKVLPGVAPGWDNSPRRRTGAIIFRNSTPEAYGRWLRHAMYTATRELSGDERIVFINAWNEWAEGNHLEPDRKWGHRYLEETLKAVTLDVDGA
jgi:lipopolysaccharide biosynthesis protein